MPPHSLSAMLLVALLAGCAADPEPPPPTAAAPADRPLDGPVRTPQELRTAALLEIAVAQVQPADLRRCLGEFGSAASGLAPPAHRTWLVVASALPADGDAFARRQAAAPELHPDPDDGWLDRIVYRALLRAADPSDPTTACLSCVFDYEGGAVVFRRALGMDRCERAVPPERDVATVVPLG